MIIEKGKTFVLMIGAVLLPGMALGAIFAPSKVVLIPSKADGPTITLNSSNQPILSNGEGTRTDEKGITWEYHNASDYAGGHVQLNSDSYFGISSATNWGITGIGGVTANFSGSELWLLMSVDGVTWSEGEVLTSGTESFIANNWRYIRFYNYSSTVTISSVNISYSCVGQSAPEDVDGANIDNIVSTASALTYDRETVELSPYSVGGEAISFTKTGTGSTNAVISFGKTYTVGEIYNRKIEFDMKTSNINYGKTIQMMKNTSSVGSSIDSSKHSSYKVTNIVDDWYHIEVPVTAFVSLISGYDTTDLPAKNLITKEVNAIKINCGTCIIDNLRISCSPCQLGLYNNGTSFSNGGAYWFKISWVGILHSCTMTFSDDTIAEQVPTDDPHIKNGSPFYIRGLSAGTVTVTATLVVGYNHRTQTISNTLTVN